MYVFIARFLGLNFGLKLMESGEDLAQDIYKGLINISPKVESIIREEEKHEKEIIGLINEESLKYVSSIVLGLNDRGPCLADHDFKVLVLLINHKRL